MRTRPLTALAAALVFASEAVVAHPGHGAEGPLHLLSDHGGLLLAVAAAALLVRYGLSARRNRGRDRRPR